MVKLFGILGKLNHLKSLLRAITSNIFDTKDRIGKDLSISLCTQLTDYSNFYIVAF